MCTSIMKKKQLYRSVIIVVVLLFSLVIGANAAGKTITLDLTAIETFSVARASNSFDVTIPAGEIVVAESSFSMAAGESVRFHAVYEPESASVDYGLISSDGLFHPIRATNGYIDASMSISTRGTYLFAIRNNSSVEVRTTGYVNY